jgi:hypothetical protein
MPIRRELRHLYTGPAWRAIRERILERAKNCCEQCGAPDRVSVLRVRGAWRNPATRTWRDKDAIVQDWDPMFEQVSPRTVVIVLTIAHLDNNPYHNADDNLAALCQWCHLHHDVALHQANARATRQARKDAARPLLRVLEVA